MNKLYNGPTWHNNTNPALNETNLNILGQAVDDIDDRVIAIAGTVMETVPQVQEDLAEAQELLEDAEAINSHPPIIGQNGNWWTWDTSTNAYVDSGKDASVTVSVNPNTETLPAGSNAYVRNVGTSTDPVLLFGIPKGDKGETGGATPGSDISGTVVDTITASTAEYPEIAASDTMKVITGKIKKFLDDLKTKKADKVTSATNGHLAGLDSNGNLTDSGSKASDFLTSHQTIKQDGVTGATVNRFGTCSTAAGTAAKTVSITTGTFSLEAGARVSVKFNNANTASTPTLNVNSTGAKNIYHKGSQITTGDNKALLAGTVDFIYDGTQWHLVGNYLSGSGDSETYTLIKSVTCAPSEQIVGYKYKQYLPRAGEANRNLLLFKRIYMIVYYTYTSGGNTFIENHDISFNPKDIYVSTDSPTNVIYYTPPVDTNSLSDKFAARVSFRTDTSANKLLYTELGIATNNDSTPTNTYTCKLYGIS